MRAKMAELADVEKAKGKTAVVDATGAVLGRLSSVLAKRLLHGESIVVLNSEKAFISGSNETIKSQYKFKVEVGTRRKGPFPSRMPHLMLKRTVRGMLPYQRPHGRAALKRLICHLGVPAEFKSAQPEKIEEATRPAAAGMTLGQVAEFLGKHIEVKPTG